MTTIMGISGLHSPVWMAWFSAKPRDRSVEWILPELTGDVVALIV